MATTLFELLGRVALDNSSANKGIKETTNIAENASQKINAAFEKIGHAAVVVGKTVAAGVAAGATAITALTKASVEGYAEYEQLVGGVETLFKDSQGKVLQYAQNAYLTAGLSANQYMETVTSFSASLLQGLDGDTAAAAEIANRAITDMSDNANKMGTDISMIQNAYQGFAKQNYTMLDNLKLGYGGTQSEMARLINESGVLGETIEVTAETVNEVPFDKIIEAIGIVQDQIGITGTTAKEAASTIQGSVASAKSAWSNLLVGMSDETADFELLIDQFVESVGVAAENILPRVEIALEGAGDLIDRLIPVIMEKVPSLVTNFLPKIVNSGVSIVKSLVDGISQNKGKIMSTATEICTTIVSVVTDLLPQILDLGMELLLTIVDGIVSNLDEISSTAIEIIEKLFDTLTNKNTLAKLLDAALEIIVKIAEGIVEFLPELSEAASSVVEQIVETVTDSETLSRLFDAAIAVIKAISQFLIDNVTLLVNAAVTIVSELAEYLAEGDNLEEIIGAACDLLEALAKGFVENVGLVAEGAARIVLAICDVISETDWLQVGWDIITSIFNGFVSGGEAFVSGQYASRDRTQTGSGGGVGGGFGGSVGSSDDSSTSAQSSTSGSSTGRKWYNNQTVASHATGLDYVPYDGYLAELHRGEMVVPAEASRFLRASGVNVSGGDVVALLERILYALQENSTGNMSLELNHREFARLVKGVT